MILLPMIYYRFQATCIMPVFQGGIISLVMLSGPGDFLSFNLAKALFSSSYEIGESITGEISSGPSMILSCDRVSLCCCVVTCILLACW